MQAEYSKWDDRLPRNERDHVRLTGFLNFYPNYILEVGETRHFKCRVL